MKKIISAIVCVSLLSYASPVLPIAFAEETTATNRIQATESEKEVSFKDRIAEVLHPEEKITSIPADHAYIPVDTIFQVELTQEISSKTMKKGNPVPLVLRENVIINDVIVVPAGTKVEGVVINAKRNGMFGRSGKLEFSINSVKSLNGVQIPLQYLTEKKAGHDGGAVAVAAVVSLVGGLFMKGKNVSFPAGSVFDARVTADTDLNVTLDELADVMNPNKPHGVSITIK